MLHQLPSAKAIKDLLEEILGKDVTVTRGAPLRAGDLVRMAAALFVEGGINMAAVVAVDAALAAHVGAAMSIVSRADAQSWGKTGVLPPVLAQNTTDLFETLQPLLEPSGGAGLKLYQTFMPGERLPADLAGQLVALGHRLDLELAITGHGGGRLSITMPYVARR